MIIHVERDLTIKDILFRRSGEDRTPGLHLSDVLKAIMVDIDPQTYGGDSSTMNWNSVEIGFTFEEILDAEFDARRMDIFRIGEIEKDGIIMSPDGLNISDFDVLEEFKSTKKSSRFTPWPCDIHDDVMPNCRMCSQEFGVKFLSWILQIKSYCYALGVTRARLRALFLDGDYSEYKRPQMPDLRTWRLEFTQKELDDHWAMILHTVEKKNLRALHPAKPKEKAA